jgi:hypothetical protein
VHAVEARLATATYCTCDFPLICNKKVKDDSTQVCESVKELKIEISFGRKEAKRQQWSL